MPFRLKINTPANSALGNVYTNFGLSTLFFFRLKILYGTEGQTNGQTDEQDP